MHSPLIDWRGLKWKGFTFICQDLAKLASVEQTSLLGFVCKYKGQGVLAAQQSLDGWLVKSPQDANAHVASAIISQSVGELEKARESLATAAKLGVQDRLYFQILFKVCLKLKDKACLKEATPQLLKISPLHGYTAQVFTDSEPQAYQRGIKESAHYIPLLSFQK